MRNVSTSLKVALFSFVCAIVLVIFSEASGIGFLLLPALISAVVSIGSLTVWICARILHRFRYSVNVIMIIVFGVAAIVSGLLRPEVYQIESVGDIFYTDSITLAWIASVCGCCASILVLIARTIFGRGGRDDYAGEYIDEVANVAVVDDVVQTPKEANSDATKM